MIVRFFFLRLNLDFLIAKLVAKLEQFDQKVSYYGIEMSILVSDFVSESLTNSALLKLDAVKQHIKRSQNGDINTFGLVSKSNRMISIYILSPDFPQYGFVERCCSQLSSMDLKKKRRLESEGHIVMNFYGKEKRKLDFNIH